MVVYGTSLSAVGILIPRKAWTLVKSRMVRCLWGGGGRVKTVPICPTASEKNAVVMYPLSIVETATGSQGRHHFFDRAVLPVVITETARAPDAAKMCAPMLSVTCIPTYITISFYESAPCDPRGRYSNVLTTRVVLRFLLFALPSLSCQ